jgi:hypothetical protein
MKRALLITAAVLAGLLALLILGSLATQIAGPRYDPVLIARQEAEVARLARQDARAEALAPLDLALGAFWKVLPAVALAGGLLYLASLGVAHVARFRHERQPDARGLLPILAADQDTARMALGGYHRARLAEAERAIVPTVPHSLSYHAPHYRGELGGDALPALAEPAALAAVPTFAQLLDSGRVGRGQPLLLGIDAETGEELPGAWLDLYATATAGLPGSGKTTSQRFFAAQTALHGARFVVCDPHASAGADSLAGTLAPLAPVYLCEPAEDPAAILQAVRFVADIGEARKSGRDRDQTPVILWVDELTGLLGRSDVGAELAGLLELIAQEYRKKWVYLSASGQIWTAARTTSELRDSLASVLCHRMKRAQARMLLPTEEAAQAERLATGEAILWRTSGVTARVRIPNTTGADVARVAQLLAGGAPSLAAASAAPPAPAPARPLGFRPALAEGANEGAFEGAQPAPLRGHQGAANLSPEEARIVAAFLGGKSPSDLAAELNGGKKSGDGYTQAARRVADILRRALGRTG